METQANKKMLCLICTCMTATVDWSPTQSFFVAVIVLVTKNNDLS